MTKKDKDLIEAAWKTSYINWSGIENLIEQAESQETKNRLQSIMRYKYHIGEQKSGIL